MTQWIKLTVWASLAGAALVLVLGLVLGTLFAHLAPLTIEWGGVPWSSWSWPAMGASGPGLLGLGMGAGVAALALPCAALLVLALVVALTLGLLWAVLAVVALVLVAAVAPLAVVCGAVWLAWRGARLAGRGRGVATRAGAGP
jgi:hypothetical protein